MTSFTDATVRNGIAHLKLFGQLQAWGAITQHIGLMLGEDHLPDYDDACRIGRETGLPVLAVKFRGRGEPGDGELNERVETALKSGLGCAFHATEVEEVESALCALEAARSRLGADALANTACRIEHGGVIGPDQIPRIAALNAWVVTNPGSSSIEAINI